MVDDVSNANETWDVNEYERALAHLESLQDQVTALRATIPSIIRPLTRSNTTKTEAFNGIKKAAIGAVTDISTFRTQWEGSQTQQILAKAKESQAKDKDLSAGKDIPAYGWTNSLNEPQDGQTMKQEEAS